MAIFGLALILIIFELQQILIIFVSTRTDEVTTINPNNNTVIHYYSASFVSQFDLSNLNTSPSEFSLAVKRMVRLNPYSERQAIAAMITILLALSVKRLSIRQGNLYIEGFVFLLSS